MSFYDEVMRAAEAIKRRTDRKPGVAIVLGSGLGALAEALENREIIRYQDIPGFPESRVEGHAGQLVFGTIGGKEVVAMQGRFHYYEGYTMKQVAFPVYVLRQLGVETLVLTNACGAINEKLEPGDLMLITDHINLTGTNSLIGPNDERFGTRFPDMTEVYDRELIRLSGEIAGELSIELKEGVYAFFSGPCYETAAEIRAYKSMGADVVGMSTVPEATAARYLGMRVLGIACITNMATGIAKTKHSHEEVLAAAGAASEKLCRLSEEVLRKFA